MNGLFCLTLTFNSLREIRLLLVLTSCCNFCFLLRYILKLQAWRQRSKVHRGRSGNFQCCGCYENINNVLYNFIDHARPSYLRHVVLHESHDDANAFRQDIQLRLQNRSLNLLLDVTSASEDVGVYMCTWVVGNLNPWPRSIIFET